jgi:hypothetical protein
MVALEEVVAIQEVRIMGDQPGTRLYLVGGQNIDVKTSFDAVRIAWVGFHRNVIADGFSQSSDNPYAHAPQE